MNISWKVRTLLSSLAIVIAACGLRTPVRPPEDTAPVIPGAVSAARDESGAVVVRWNRAEQSADGLRLEDLASFAIERKPPGDAAWQRIGTIDVVDQEKIRRRRDFSYRDSTAGAGDAWYRVIAVTADGHEGPPTGSVLSVDQPEPEGSK